MPDFRTVPRRQAPFGSTEQNRIGCPSPTCIAPDGMRTLPRMPPDLRILRASSLGHAALAALFERAYEGYPVAMHVDEALLRMMVEIYDEDLEASVVLRSGERDVGLAMLGIRGPSGWVGGMGVVATDRRQGLGRAVMEAVLQNARERGLTQVWLEVLEQNVAAHTLYEALGFRDVRALEVWSLPAASEASGLELHMSGAPEGPLLEREPWQRTAATREHLANRPPGVEHLALQLDGREAGITWRVNGEARSLLDARGGDGPRWWGRALSMALHAQGAKSLRVLNAEAGGVLAEAARSAGGTRDAGQWEMCLQLEQS